MGIADDCMDGTSATRTLNMTSPSLLLLLSFVELDCSCDISTALQQNTIPPTLIVMGCPHRGFFGRNNLAITFGGSVKNRLSPLSSSYPFGTAGYRNTNRAPFPLSSITAAIPNTRNVEASLLLAFDSDITLPSTRLPLFHTIILLKAIRSEKISRAAVVVYRYPVLRTGTPEPVHHIFKILGRYVFQIYGHTGMNGAKVTLRSTILIWVS